MPKSDPGIALLGSKNEDARAMKLLQDPDYIAINRFQNSLVALLERYPDGAPDNIVAQALLMEESGVEAAYQAIVIKLRDRMGV